MRVKILRSTTADGRDVFAGAIEDLSDADARLLIRIGKASNLEKQEPAVLTGGEGAAEEMPGQAPPVLTEEGDAPAADDPFTTEAPAAPEKSKIPRTAGRPKNKKG